MRIRPNPRGEIAVERSADRGRISDVASVDINIPDRLGHQAAREKNCIAHPPERQSLNTAWTNRAGYTR